MLEDKADIDAKVHENTKLKELEYSHIVLEVFL